MLVDVLKQSYPRNRYVDVDRRNKLIGGIMIYVRRFNVSEDNCRDVHFAELLDGFVCTGGGIDSSSFSVDPVRPRIWKCR